MTDISRYSCIAIYIEDIWCKVLFNASFKQCLNQAWWGPFQCAGDKKKQATSWDRKTNHETSRDKKKSVNLLVPKKSRNLSGQKKITQPLGTTKNHSTSWAKKCPKNSNLSHNQNSGNRHRSPWSCFGFLAALSSSRRVNVRPSVGPSVGPSADVCEKVTFRVSKGN